MKSPGGYCNDGSQPLTLDQLLAAGYSLDEISKKKDRSERRLREEASAASCLKAQALKQLRASRRPSEPTIVTETPETKPKPKVIPASAPQDGHRSRRLDHMTTRTPAVIPTLPDLNGNDDDSSETNDSKIAVSGPISSSGAFAPPPVSERPTQPISPALDNASFRGTTTPTSVTMTHTSNGRRRSDPSSNSDDMRTPRPVPIPGLPQYNPPSQLRSDPNKTTKMGARCA